MFKCYLRPEIHGNSQFVILLSSLPTHAGKNREGIELKENNTSTDKPAEGGNEKSNESDTNHQPNETS